jgi:hypothetical protein
MDEVIAEYIAKQDLASDGNFRVEGEPSPGARACFEQEPSAELYSEGGLEAGPIKPWPSGEGC